MTRYGSAPAKAIWPDAKMNWRHRGANAAACAALNLRRLVFRRWLGFGLGLMLIGCDAPVEVQVSPDSRQAMTGLRLGAVLGGRDTGFAVASNPRVFEFPKDHGEHTAFRSEWWYLTCPLRDASGAEFGVQFTLFRQALTPPLPQGSENAESPGSLWRSGQIYMAHAALTDVEQGVHTEGARLSRGHPALAGVTSAQLNKPFEAFLEDWRLAARDGSLTSMTLDLSYADERDAAKGFDVHLALAPQQPPILQGDAGLSSKGVGQASYYYSIPRVKADGVLRASPTGVKRSVVGACWFDREWSTSVLAPGVDGWDWLALQFDDGSELMAFQLRSNPVAVGGQSAVRQAKRIDPQGVGRSVPESQIDFAVTRQWRDEAGIEWPTAWTVNVEGISYQVRAALDDQRMRSNIAYWEGLVWVFDEHDRRIGQGYLEMTGYQ